MILFYIFFSLCITMNVQLQIYGIRGLYCDQIKVNYQGHKISECLDKYTYTIESFHDLLFAGVEIIFYGGNNSNSYKPVGISIIKNSKIVLSSSGDHFQILHEKYIGISDYYEKNGKTIIGECRINISLHKNDSIINYNAYKDDKSFIENIIFFCKKYNLFPVVRPQQLMNPNYNRSFISSYIDKKTADKYTTHFSNLLKLVKEMFRGSYSCHAYFLLGLIKLDSFYSQKHAEEDGQIDEKCDSNYYNDSCYFDNLNSNEFLNADNTDSNYDESYKTNYFPISKYSKETNSTNLTQSQTPFYKNSINPSFLHALEIESDNTDPQIETNKHILKKSQDENEKNVYNGLKYPILRRNNKNWLMEPASDIQGINYFTYRPYTYDHLQKEMKNVLNSNNSQINSEKSTLHEFEETNSEVIQNMNDAYNFEQKYQLKPPKITQSFKIEANNKISMIKNEKNLSNISKNTNRKSNELRKNNENSLFLKKECEFYENQKLKQESNLKLQENHEINNNNDKNEESLTIKLITSNNNSESNISNTNTAKKSETNKTSVSDNNFESKTKDNYELKINEVLNQLGDNISIESNLNKEEYKFKKKVYENNLIVESVLNNNDRFKKGSNLKYESESINEKKDFSSLNNIYQNKFNEIDNNTTTNQEQNKSKYKLYDSQWHEYYLNKYYYAIAGYSSIFLSAFIKKRTKVSKIYTSTERMLLERLNIEKKDLLSIALDSETSETPHIIFYDRIEKEIVVSFRGTQDHNDALNDLDCEYQFFFDGFGHSGFIKLADIFINNHLDELEEHLKNKKTNKILFTGQSLGGALATLIYIIIKEKKKLENCQIRVISFSAPPTVSENLCGEKYNEITNIIYGNDVFPRLSYGSLMDLKYLSITVSKIKNADSSTLYNAIKEIIVDMNKKNANIKLFIPGKIFHIKKRILEKNTEKIYFWDYIYNQVQVLVKEVDYKFLSNIVIHKKMYLHHLFKPLIDAFEIGINYKSNMNDEKR